MNESKMSLIGAGRDFTLACSEQPQARLELLGPASLSDAELLALFLGGPTGSRKMDLAHHLIAVAGSLAGLSKLAAMDFRQLPGVGQVRSQFLVAVLEMSRRMTQTTAEATVLNRPELIADYMQPTVRELEVEKFWVLCLNRKNRLKRRCEVTSGTATSSLAHPREVFRCAIRESATSIVCVHNHPSGDPAPSAADVQVTRQLREAAKAVDIELLDHVIVGRPSADPLGRGFYSFRESGVI